MDSGAEVVSKSRLVELIERFPETSVVVLGDFILDEFVFGEIARISREAPVLILSYQETRSAAGGGANAAAGVAALGGRALPIGVLGSDEAAGKLLSCWPESMDKSGVWREPGGLTTRKTRILAGSFHSFRQQVVRLDHEHPLRLSPQQEDRLANAFRERLDGADAVILSDYGLGTLTPGLRRTAIEAARRLSKPVVVDSRFEPAGYPGATSATPNITEVEESLGRRIGHEIEAIDRTGAEVRRQWKLDALLVTRGKLGMSLFEAERVVHIPAHGIEEAVDVTGAGDTVIATYTTALAAGGSFEEAARLANCAGGVVVGKKGTATVSREELLEAVQA